MNGIWMVRRGGSSKENEDRNAGRTDERLGCPYGGAKGCHGGSNDTMDSHENDAVGFSGACETTKTDGERNEETSTDNHGDGCVFRKIKSIASFDGHETYGDGGGDSSQMRAVESGAKRYDFSNSI